MCYTHLQIVARTFWPWFNLETAVGSQKSAQALGAPGEIKKGSSPNRVGHFWGFSLPSFVRRGRGGRGPRPPLRSLVEHPIPIRDHVSSLLSNPVRAFSMAAVRSLPRALPHLAHAFAKALRRAGRSPYKGEGEASRKPGHFSHGRKTHPPRLQQAFQEMTRPNLPTHLGEDPILFVMSCTG